MVNKNESIEDLVYTLIDGFKGQGHRDVSWRRNTDRQFDVDFLCHVLISYFQRRQIGFVSADITSGLRR